MMSARLLLARGVQGQSAPEPQPLYAPTGSAGGYAGPPTPGPGYGNNPAWDGMLPSAAAGRWPSGEAGPETPGTPAGTAHYGGVGRPVRLALTRINE